MALDTAAHPQEFLHQHAPGSGETEIILVLAHELKKRSPTKSEFAQLVDLLRVPGASAMNVNKLCEETKEHPVILELKERRLGATNAVMTLNLAWLALQGTSGLEPTGPGREEKKKGWRVEGGEWRTKHLTLQKKRPALKRNLRLHGSKLWHVKSENSNTREKPEWPALVSVMLSVRQQSLSIGMQA